MTDLWTNATADYEAERKSELVLAARVASAHVWSLLAKSSDLTDYLNRKALVTDTIHKECARVSPGDFAEIADAVMEGFDRDYAVLAAAKPKPEETEKKDRFSDEDATFMDFVKRKKEEDGPPKKEKKESFIKASALDEAFGLEGEYTIGPFGEITANENGSGRTANLKVEGAQCADCDTPNPHNPTGPSNVTWRCPVHRRGGPKPPPNPAPKSTVQMFSNTKHWMEAHQDGCAHLTKHPYKNSDPFPVSGASKQEVANDACSDFINEGSMSHDEAVDAIHWAPCVKLPHKSASHQATIEPDDETSGGEDSDGTEDDANTEKTAASTKMISQNPTVPSKSEDWPWDKCPDCNKKPGQPHTDMCGSLDKKASLQVTGGAPFYDANTEKTAARNPDAAGWSRPRKNKVKEPAKPSWQDKVDAANASAAEERKLREPSGQYGKARDLLNKHNGDEDAAHAEYDGLDHPGSAWSNAIEDHKKKTSSLQVTGGAPFYVRRMGKEYAVVNKDGEVKGTHPDINTAKGQQKALYRANPRTKTAPPKGKGQPAQPSQAGASPSKGVSAPSVGGGSMKAATAKPSRFKRLLKAITGAETPLLEKCPICGEEIPVSVIKAHMANDHHDVPRHTSSFENNPYKMDDKEVGMANGTDSGTNPQQNVSMPANMNPEPDSDTNKQASKIAEMAEGVLYSNPGLSEPQAIHLATRAYKLAMGGADYLKPGDEYLSKCSQCGKGGFNAMIGRCHSCGFVKTPTRM
jgi:ribosomal protein L37E